MDIKPIIESLLFAAGEPLSLKRLSRITGEREKRIKEILEELREEYENQKKGMTLLNNDEQWLMTTAPEATSFVQRLKKETMEGNLSTVSQEAMAIIAYRGPITRAEINEIRGVDSSYILQQLLSRGLIERSRHPDRLNTYLYNISFALLQHLGVNNIQELPQYEEFNRQKQ